MLVTCMPEANAVLQTAEPEETLSERMRDN